MAALALTLRYLAGGREEIQETLPIDPAKLLGAGIVISSTAAVFPMFFGYPPLMTDYVTAKLPLVGEFDIPSALVFDAGVYTIVIGLIMHVLTSMGAYLDREEDTRKERARDRARELQKKNERRRRQQSQARKDRFDQRVAVSGSGSSISKVPGGEQ